MTNRSRSNATAAPGVDTTKLRATPEATARYAQRFGSRFEELYRTTPFDLRVSSIGIGTYLGDSTDEDDDLYESAITHAIEHGINLVDTAINYRCQRSERTAGSAIQRVIAGGAVSRDQLVVCSKGGYIPLNVTPPASREAYRDYVQREFIDPEILRPDEIVAGGHSLAPRFLRYCIAKSRQNLGLRTIDVYYLHNPEQQAATLDHEDLKDRLRGAMAALEESASRDEIGVYGCATWDAFRVAPDARDYLSIEELVTLAHDVGGRDHRFRVVQMPINLAMPEAVRVPTQSMGGKMVTAVEAAEALGLMVVASASLMQGRLASGLPTAVVEAFPGLQSDSQRALAFARGVPGVTSALVGMKRREHVSENLGL